MKTRKLALVLAIVMVFAVTAQAAARVNYYSPGLYFSGTIAYCEIDVISPLTTDSISVTLTLWQGNTMVDSWSSSGKGVVSMNEAANATSGKSYTLIASVTINGVLQPEVPVTRTCP